MQVNKVTTLTKLYRNPAKPQVPAQQDIFISVDRKAGIDEMANTIS